MKIVKTRARTLYGLGIAGALGAALIHSGSSFGGITFSDAPRAKERAIATAGAAADLPDAAPALPNALPPALPNDPNIYVELSRKVIPSVVNISAVQSSRGPRYGNSRFLTPEEMFRGFLSPPSLRPRSEVPQPRAGSLGTGFVIAPPEDRSLAARGTIIVTNNHVVEGADEIFVTFTESPEERPSPGRVIGRDPELDVALIQVDSDRQVGALRLGDSDRLQVGEYVAAVGNPFGQGHSLTHGIISAKGRHIPDLPFSTYLQTDAPINPGNSGGPLLNLKGEVIGINNAIDARAQGIGFAIPINQVKSVLPQLLSKGAVARGYLGIGVSELHPGLARHLGLPDDLKAPVVTEVYDGSPAARSDLKPYDVITRFDGKPVRSSAELIAAVSSLQAGSQVPVEVRRDGKSSLLKVLVGERPRRDG